MHKTSFNKLKNDALCIVCKVNRVPLNEWNRPCAECRGKKAQGKKQKELLFGKRLPAAIIKTDRGKEIYVDKFGNEVENPGYNLKNDPRGYKFTKTVKDKKTII